MTNFLILLFVIIFSITQGKYATAKDFDIGVKEDSFTVIVNSKAGPWNPLINKSKDYRFKSNRRFKFGNSQSPPTILKVIPGDDLIIQYLSGDVYADKKGYPQRKTDAAGYPEAMPTYQGRLPSSYIDGQINHMALIGTFADSKGVIVGSPFLVGDTEVNLTVPDGAEQLQLGVNDNLFKDNAGLFIVKVNVNKDN